MSSKNAALSTSKAKAKCSLFTSSDEKYHEVGDLEKRSIKATTAWLRSSMAWFGPENVGLHDGAKVPIFASKTSASFFLL